MKKNPSVEFGKVGVLMGGYSAEREISLLSGRAILAGLRAQAIDAYPIEVERDLLTPVMEARVDRVFIALHGRGGEDGVIQGALAAVGIPFTGTGVLGSALAMDKLRTKQLWNAARLPTPASKALAAESDIDVEYARRIIARLGPAVIVKPAAEGSSVGMARASTAQELVDAVKLASRYDCPVLIEHWIEGDEYTVGILGDRALPGIRLQTPRTFYDFEAKYRSDSTLYHCPCGLAAAQEAELAKLSLDAFYALSCSGWGRVDLMRDTAGRWFLLEINTVPGMTDKSLLPMAAKHSGTDFAKLTVDVLKTSLGT